METLSKELDNQTVVDYLQSEMSKEPQVECPVFHYFTKGLYTREILMPKGTFIISKIHNTEHPFVVTMGSCKVWIDGVGWEIISAPYTGITKPGTRRVLEVLEDCLWLTFHPMDFITGDEKMLDDNDKEQVVSKIEDIIIDKRELNIKIEESCKCTL